MKKPKNFDSAPVTRGEFREAIEELQEHVDDSRAEFRAAIKDLKGIVMKILKTVESIDARAKEPQDIPERVARLERPRPGCQRAEKSWDCGHLSGKCHLSYPSWP